jgi:hypothetical protein
MDLNEKYNLLDADLEASQILYGFKKNKAQIFLEERCEFLLDQDIIQDYHIVEYENDTLGCRIDAWGFKPMTDAGEESLVLILSDYREDSILGSQTLSNFKKYLSKGKRFADLAIKESFRLNEIIYGTPIAGLADYIYEKRTDLSTITIVGLTNTKITSRDNSLVIVENSNANFVYKYDVWDFERIAKIDFSQSGRESVDIDFVNQYQLADGVPALKASVACDDISSFLFVLPAKTLNEMYDRWNERLLEQNPRTFLQFTGKVNKGLRATILNDPEKFFSYNNGISAVAQSLEFDEEKGRILSLQNFQIVNGGQTTASIYNTVLKAKRDKTSVALEKIFVMVKLSVINNSEKALEIIPKISEYSNTQNKVNTASFSNHHEFHKAMEKFSRSIWTLSVPGQRETHWYYERVLGQYKNAINLCKTKSERTEFEITNPKRQMFKTVDLAKYILAFDKLPQKVCLGAQKCYALFCQQYLKIDSFGQGVIDGSVNENFFKENCAKALIFKALEERQGNGVRFVSVPYIISLVVSTLERRDLVLDYQNIWRKQWDNDILFDTLAGYGSIIVNRIIETMPETSKLLSEWGKKDECWQAVQAVQLDISALKEYCISKIDYLNNKDSSKAIGTIDLGIDDQTFVITKGDKYWKELLLWTSRNLPLSEKEYSILNYATNFKKTIPSAKQCAVIRKIENKALSVGFTSSWAPNKPASKETDIIELLKEEKIQYEDNRKIGGALWIIGGHELDDFVNECKSLNIKFTYKEEGNRTTNYRPAWWYK